MPLPTTKTTGQKPLDRATIFLYGSPKTGKSSLAAEFPEAIFLATEAGHGYLPVYKMDINSLADFEAASAEIAAGKHGFKTVIVDTIDNFYRLVCQKVVGNHKVEYLNDGTLAYGKGKALVNNEMFRILTWLSKLPYGLILISHAYPEEVETRTGTITRFVPTLPGGSKGDGPREAVLGMCDMILYLSTDSSGNRVLHTKPSMYHMAGERSGRLPETLKITDPASGYHQLVAAGK